MLSAPDDQFVWIAQAKAGNGAALEKLLLIYSDQLSAHIATRLPPFLQRTYSVEDVTQQALTKAFLKIDRLRKDSPPAFVLWLKAIGEKTLMEMIKAERRQKRGRGFQRVQFAPADATASLYDIIEHLPAATATASQMIARREALAALQVGIAGLATDQRQAIRLHLLERRTLDETALAMGRSPGAIRGLVQRGKQRLGEAMGRASAWLSTK